MTTIRVDKNRVKRHFDRYADDYDRNALVQIGMGDRLLELIEQRISPDRVGHILEIGCGTGRLTASLLTRFPKARVYAVDLAPQMVRLTLERCSAEAEAGRLVVVSADAEGLTAEHFRELRLPEQADLIVSSATVQWFNEPADTMRAWLRMLKPEGVLAFATFGPRTFHELHDSFTAAAESLQAAGRRRGQHFLSLSDWESLLDGASEEVTRAFTGEETMYELHFRDVRSFLYSVKKTGAGNANQEPAGGGGISRKLLAAMEKAYVERYREPEGIRATYHLLYGLFGKG
ncbi:malonyl-ACP O-methyltransferase BioC [Paenibacillus validus]|uniref:Malonyl-[acyl-carrier protein] O-methyltransferase n=1 Tax=Paenibacillus validus TaxID=44253 RepID=A0A7X2ZF32_9BACL|nr:malonyl-ACP O-methyltransferase BioC [Paenibacillus validus]MED4602306.1 malonyl-ACP O-methyltransferase BioC [Paenibacillus validus]MED4608778.1 malonyl-ACP O-methyltransferase BioC [Paenibacillus validus]MUG73716.1 malonyl-ACP O-methyltransferase BioC [Paenibacillus validus]